LIAFHGRYHRTCILKHLAIRLNLTGNSRGSRTLDAVPCAEDRIHTSWPQVRRFARTNNSCTVPTVQRLDYVSRKLTIRD
jgi:hypothetical protein